MNSSLIRVGSNRYLKRTDGELTKKGVAECIGKLASNFKKLDNSFFSILTDRARKNGFDDEALNKAVDTVIDTFHYNEPKVADIISLNPNVKVLTYHEVVSLNDKMNRKAFEYYRPIVIPNSTAKMYAHINDINRYNLQYAPIKEYNERNKK